LKIDVSEKTVDEIASQIVETL
ncbi:MAG: hypothetical protein RL534_346, partial [Actinomycetota bacterium]